MRANRNAALPSVHGSIDRTTELSSGGSAAIDSLMGDFDEPHDFGPTDAKMQDAPGRHIWKDPLVGSSASSSPHAQLADSAALPSFHGSIAGTTEPSSGSSAASDGKMQEAPGRHIWKDPLVGSSASSSPRAGPARDEAYPAGPRHIAQPRVGGIGGGSSAASSVPSFPPESGYDPAASSSARSSTSAHASSASHSASTHPLERLRADFGTQSAATDAANVGLARTLLNKIKDLF